MKRLEPNRNRALIGFAKKQFPGSNPTISFLKAVVVLKNNLNVYKFSFNQFDSSEAPGEVKLPQTDAFVVDKLAYFIASRNANEAGTERLVTYPDTTIFPNVTGATGLVAGSPADFKNSHLNAIYNGQYKINLNNRDIFEKVDMQRHLYVPRQDQSIPMRENPEAGFLKIEPYLILRGQTKHYLEVLLPAIANMRIEAVRQTGQANEQKEHILVAYAMGAYVNSGAQRM